jgi:N-acetylglutamate synthase-like GNAT family acetyltransferase
MSQFSIRKATQEDLPNILELLKELDLDGDQPMPLEQARRLFQRIASYPNYSVYLAESDGRPVGTYALLIMDKLEHGGAPSGIVDSVAVSAACQGQGIGKLMMRHAQEQCRRHGAYKLMLSSNMSRTDAHAFYEALGFERHGFSYKITISS